MSGAHERNVLRWDAQRALLDREVERLERELAHVERVGAGSQGSGHQVNPDQIVSLRRQLEAARQRRQALGPTPRPKMG